MTRLIFIRHAESDNNVKNEVNRPLTNFGLKSANRIPKLFLNTSIHHFYSSPYVRTIETIKPLAKQKEMDILLRPNLKERKIGIWVDDFFKYAQKQWNNFDYKIEQGESLREVQKRNIAEVMKIINDHKNQTIVIGTHGTALCTILNHFDRKYNFDYFQSIAKKMPLFIEVRFNGQKLQTIEELSPNFLNLFK